MPEATAAGDPQPVVPHRRPRSARRRRLLLLRRPQHRLDPPPRREHLGVRGRGGDQLPPGRARGRRVRGAERRSARTTSWSPIVARPAARSTPSSWSRSAPSSMARHMVPRYVDVVDALPKTPTEKVEKYRLAARGPSRDDLGPRGRVILTSCRRRVNEPSKSPLDQSTSPRQLAVRSEIRGRSRQADSQASGSPDVAS